MSEEPANFRGGSQEKSSKCVHQGEPNLISRPAERGSAGIFSDSVLSVLKRMARNRYRILAADGGLWPQCHSVRSTGLTSSAHRRIPTSRRTIDLARPTRRQ